MQWKCRNQNHLPLSSLEIDIKCTSILFYGLGIHCSFKLIHTCDENGNLIIKTQRGCEVSVFLVDLSLAHQTELPGVDAM